MGDTSETRARIHQAVDELKEEQLGKLLAFVTELMTDGESEGRQLPSVEDVRNSPIYTTKFAVVPDLDLPEDLSVNLDHYLYGADKVED